jgi:hypothetical protein
MAKKFGFSDFTKYCIAMQMRGYHKDVFESEEFSEAEFSEVVEYLKDLVYNDIQ